MPSPVGHTLIGLALAAAALPRAGLRERLRRDGTWLAGAVVLANLPDLDYLPGIVAGDLNAYHHGYTHTLGWILIVTAGVGLAWRAWVGRGAGWRRLAVVFALLASHLAADWATDDRRPPLGIMAFWPASREYHMAAHPIFPRLLKKNFGEFIQPHNFYAVGVEMAWCLPALAAVLWLRRPCAAAE